VEVFGHEVIKPGWFWRAWLIFDQTLACAQRGLIDHMYVTTSLCGITFGFFCGSSTNFQDWFHHLGCFSTILSSFFSLFFWLEKELLRNNNLVVKHM
jgi:hypothetical protein